MSKALEVQIEYDSLAQYFGAIGAAVYAFRSNKIDLLLIRAVKNLPNDVIKLTIIVQIEF